MLKIVSVCTLVQNLRWAEVLALCGLVLVCVLFPDYTHLGEHWTGWPWPYLYPLTVGLVCGAGGAWKFPKWAFGFALYPLLVGLSPWFLYVFRISVLVYNDDPDLARATALLAEFIAGDWKYLLEVGFGRSIGFGVTLAVAWAVGLILRQATEEATLR